MGNNPRVFWKDGEYIEDTKENRQAIRITELEQQLNEAKAGWDSAIADLYAAAEIAKGMQSQLADERLAFDHANEVIGKLEADIAALSWTRITPETKFDRSLDYLLGRPLRGCSVIRGDDFQRDGAGAHLKRVGWTHFRPINPPPPSGAKGETIVFQENINE